MSTDKALDQARNAVKYAENRVKALEADPAVQEIDFERVLQDLLIAKRSYHILKRRLSIEASGAL